ncbi:MAG: hypothetical protein IGR76_18640 [Synechococcales cyanobacterium T60_A2020_003]|nr:hypothetical protein [Synechococcales cyanobacterium T60_A2020_003]
MTPADIEAILNRAFQQCEVEGEALSDRQQQLLLALVGSDVMAAFNQAIAPDPAQNPLDLLTPEQRSALLDYIQRHSDQDISWKVDLLNDWLQGRDSGSVQFIRDEYGLPWLEQVQPIHINRYLESEALTLNVGDRIEVSNALWEWVQDGDQEWFPCTVIHLKSDPLPGEPNRTCCIVRFDNGMEAEIQGIYDWNRYHWRSPQR